MAESLNAIGLPHLLALAAALGWASGMRLYATVLIVGLAGRYGALPLPEGLQVLTHGGVLIASGALAAIEFLADKIPAVDSAWDAVHTLIRIPAGAALAFGVLSGYGVDGPAWSVIAALLGGTLAATAHAAKAGTRAAANTSPEPFSNITLSLLGDALVPALLWLAWSHPLVFTALLALLVIVAVVLIRLTFKLPRGLFKKFQAA